MTSVPDPRFHQAAWSWVQHLRGGGSTPWARWLDTDTDTDTDPDGADRPLAEAGSRLPGAAQLEVVRRLAARREAEQRTSRIDFPRLADLVLGRSAPGRGLPELPLAWPGSDVARARFGAPPVDPEQVPVEELLRVCVGALVELVGSLERPGHHRSTTPPRRPWAKQFHLAGTPVTTAAVRAALAGAGRVEGGRKPEVLVIAAGFDEMLKQVWSSRVQRYGSETRWARFVARWEAQARLPMSADLPVIARHWADRVGPERVHVVVSATGDADQVRRTAAEVLGVPDAGAGDTSSPEPVSLLPAEVDVFRRMNAILNVRLTPERHRALLPAVTGLLRSGDTAALLVPEAHAEWARERSLELVRDLASGGYAVHGDLQQIVSDRSSGAPSAPGARRALDVALGACLSAMERERE